MDINNKENKVNLKEEIKDALTCFICYEKINNPVFCPKCKKLGCFECLKKWFKELNNKCPFCKTVMTLNDMPKLEFLNPISEYFIKKINKSQIIEEKENGNINNNIKQVNQIKGPSLGKSQILSNPGIINNSEIDCISEQPKTSILKKSKGKYCTIHPNELLEYICIDCETKHCSKCLMVFNDESKVHLDHTVENLEKYEKYKLKEIFSEIKYLSTSKSTILIFCENINSELKIYQNEEDIILKMIEKFKNTYKEKIQNKKESLKRKKNKIQKKIDDIEKISNYWEKAVKNFVDNNDQNGIREYRNRIESLKNKEEFQHPNKFIIEFNPKLKSFESDFHEIPLNMNRGTLGEKSIKIKGLEEEIKVKIVGEADNEILFNLQIQLNDLMLKENKNIHANLIIKRGYDNICALNLDERMVYDKTLILGKTLIRKTLNNYINTFLYKCNLKIIIYNIRV